jgi:hypothetical protein
VMDLVRLYRLLPSLEGGWGITTPKQWYQRYYWA